jgi:calcineurin-like phosphoesterase family protein
MPREFFISDTHFGHANILTMCNRPFSSIEEHDRVLVESWNAVVGAQDIVWHLGDFSYSKDPKAARRVFEQLNGHKRLVLGNHDFRGGTKALGWESVQHYAETSIDGVRIIMFHYGMRVWPGMHHGAVMLYGHSHGRLPGNQQSMDVGVDVMGFAPVTWPQIRARLAELPPLRFAEGTDETEDGDGE